MDDLEKICDHGKNIAEEDREMYLCINKMLAYLFAWFVCHIDEQVIKNVNENNAGKVCQLFASLYAIKLYWKIQFMFF